MAEVYEELKDKDFKVKELERFTQAIGTTNEIIELIQNNRTYRIILRILRLYKRKRSRGF